MQERTFFYDSKVFRFVCVCVCVCVPLIYSLISHIGPFLAVLKSCEDPLIFFSLGVYVLSLIVVQRGSMLLYSINRETLPDALFIPSINTID